jgi:hypothetical protein
MTEPFTEAEDPNEPARKLVPVGDADDASDFAEEHDDTTLADQVENGPEHAREDASPRGRGGDGGMDIGRHG